MTVGQRLTVARRLFGDWTGVTNPDLLAALWSNLSAGDRKVWLEQADEFRTAAANNDQARSGLQSS